MANKDAKPVHVTCPCCQAKLTIDPALEVVLAHEAPPRAAPDVDISDSERILREQAEAREAKFRESFEAEQKKEDVLARKFEEALKKAKDAPAEKPIRHFDLD